MSFRTISCKMNSLPKIKCVFEDPGILVWMDFFSGDYIDLGISSGSVNSEFH